MCKRVDDTAGTPLATLEPDNDGYLSDSSLARSRTQALFNSMPVTRKKTLRLLAG